jgi:hypothetical protein
VLDADLVSPSRSPFGGPCSDAESDAAEVPCDALELTLVVRDREVIEELLARSPRERGELATAALRIGVLALRTARGQVDVDAVRGEVERMLLELRKGLDEHRDRLGSDVGSVLREYFDPRDGRFAERVRRLVEDDGELARVIRAQVEGADSALARTLASHVGAESPLLRLLDPASGEGVVSGVARSVDAALAAQRERILREFSLDHREGALARLVAELTASHGKLGEALSDRIDSVVREFSLDAEDSALSRLVRRVERAQQQIADEFTLDSETSALARLRRELLAIANAQNAALAALQERVQVELAKLTATRETAARSTTHGDAFEAALLGWLEARARQAGDVFEATGATTGTIKHCKVGDAVVELGPEHRAAGARIVFEAKEDAATRLAGAREEIDTARKNRRAEVGVFVLSARSAPPGFERFRAIGPDLFAVWDADDPATDVFLEAALALARALCTRARHAAPSQLDLAAFDRAIRDVEKQLAGLSEIQTSAGTIESGAIRIRERARKMVTSLERAVETLDAACAAARSELGGGE